MIKIKINKTKMFTHRDYKVTILESQTAPFNKIFYFNSKHLLTAVI